MDDQSRDEIGTFSHFVEVAGLPVLPATIEKRFPPEPDVRCRLETGGSVAFELVEICNPANARFMFSAQRIHNAIMDAYNGLEASSRESFERCFVNRPLSFYFRPESSVVRIKNILPALLMELLSATPTGDEFVSFSPTVAGAVTKVRFAGRLNDPGAVNFNLGGSFDPTVPMVAISSKLSKTYQTDCPIELLAHFGGLAWGQDRLYQDVLVKLLRERGLGPFRRVWVLDWEGIALVFPDTLVSRIAT